MSRKYSLRIFVDLSDFGVKSLGSNPGAQQDNDDQQDYISSHILRVEKTRINFNESCISWVSLYFGARLDPILSNRA